MGKKSPSYWWGCKSCGHIVSATGKAAGKYGIGVLVNTLIDSTWQNQAVLLKECPSCEAHEMQLTYEFPGRDIKPVLVRVVGLGPNEDGYVPMMWETIHMENDKEVLWFDFKYMNIKRPCNLIGLQKPAVFERKDLSDLFALYLSVARIKHFP